MEEFEHMNVDEFNEEEFYETIEAPKFVDLTAPDHRPEGDDRFWFCSRVGCDQKHEEFLDSEVIYKNFVLRVMAARSPSVRMRKALYGKDFSVDPKCPNTVPAKPSRSRVSKLAMISTIPHKGNGSNRSKEVKLVSKNKNATTPKAKVLPVPQKALTERKKQMQSPVAFRSVQNPRNGTIKVSENKVVAKALVFQSPKKVVKLKRSVELSSSVKKLCNGMRKFEIEDKRKGLGVNHKVVSSAPSKRPLRTREVKSRVFDSVRSQKHIDETNNGVTTLTKRVKKKEEPEPVLSSDSSKAHEAHRLVLENQSLPSTENTREDKEVMFENKSEELSDTLKANMNNQLQAREDPAKAHESNGMVHENQSLPSTEKASGDEELMVENKSEESSDDTLKANNMNNLLQAREDPELIKESGLATPKQYQITDIEEKVDKLALECEDKENTTIAADREDISVVKMSEPSEAKQCETVENEDKENALPLECGNKENALPLECENKENYTNVTDADREGDDKENSSALDTNRKVDQATYPLMKKKVFGKKETCKTTQKVMTVADKCFNGKTITAGTRVKYTKPKLTNPKPFRLRTDERQILKEANTEKKPHCTIAKEELVFNGENLAPKHQTVRLEKNKACRGTSKTLVSENMMNSKRFVLGGKKQVATKGIETVTDTKEVAIIKPSVCVASGEKRSLTVPKGPNFHSIHIPKSCTKRVASPQV